MTRWWLLPPFIAARIRIWMHTAADLQRKNQIHRLKMLGLLGLRIHLVWMKNSTQSADQSGGILESKIFVRVSMIKVTEILKDYFFIFHFIGLGLFCASMSSEKKGENTEIYLMARDADKVFVRVAFSKNNFSCTCDSNIKIWFIWSLVESCVRHGAMRVWQAPSLDGSSFSIKMAVRMCSTFKTLKMENKVKRT